MKQMGTGFSRKNKGNDDSKWHRRMTHSKDQALKNQVAWMCLIGNIGLLFLKGIVGYISGSLIVISDALNSFGDIIASIVVQQSVAVSDKKADAGHPFGHSRAEPIAALVIGVFTGMLGFSVLGAAISRLIEGSVRKLTLLPIIVLSITIVVKFFMYVYTRKAGRKTKSPALLATAADHINDVILSSSALVAAFIAFAKYPIMDAIGALLISVWILYSAVNIVRENISYLMGGAPTREFCEKIRREAEGVAGVSEVISVRAHYVGPEVHVEITIGVRKSTSLMNAHRIAERVRAKVEAIDTMGRAFVHVEPVRNIQGKRLK